MKIIIDNKEILKYRGILRPDNLELNRQKRARRQALIRLNLLNTTSRSEYLLRKKSSGANQVAVPKMRLLPNSKNDKIYDFYFPFLPTDIQYSDLSDEVAEIQRPGTTPLIVFRSHRLMRISMEFLVAVPYDGLITDVEDSLKILRRFSTHSDRSVIFYHLDDMLMKGWKYRNGPADRVPRFNIVELSITARQRNASGKITQANVSMTIVENQNPKVSIVKIPPFTPLPLTPEEKKKQLEDAEKAALERAFTEDDPEPETLIVVVE